MLELTNMCFDMPRSVTAADREWLRKDMANYLRDELKPTHSLGFTLRPKNIARWRAYAAGTDANSWLDALRMGGNGHSAPFHRRTRSLLIAYRHDGLMSVDGAFRFEPTTLAPDTNAILPAFFERFQQSCDVRRMWGAPIEDIDAWIETWAAKAASSDFLPMRSDCRWSAENWDPADDVIFDIGYAAPLAA